MAKKIALGIAAVLVLSVLVVLLLAATKPDRLHIERSLVMQGTPAQVFPYANDFTKFTTWIPWTKLDPEQAVEFSDPPAGVGAWYTWKGNDEVGEGRMEVLSAEPGKVVHELAFIEPFASVAESSVIMEPAGSGEVKVTWAYDQEADFATKLMTVFMDMDAMMGPDFEAGLTALEQLVQAEGPAVDRGD